MHNLVAVSKLLGFCSIVNVNVHFAVRSKNILSVPYTYSFLYHHHLTVYVFGLLLNPVNAFVCFFVRPFVRPDICYHNIS